VTRFVAPAPRRDVVPGAPPTFSVIIAAYQAAHLVGDAVSSALDQTLPAHEVIVCDDGSSDDIESALAPYRDRIVLIRQENRGEASAKNTAARAASGDFVAILDADDTYLPRRLEALARLAAARPDLDILTTDAYLEFDGDVLRRSYTGGFRFITDDQRRGILEDNFIFGHAAVRRERLRDIDGFDESILFATDWDCWIRLILDGSRAGLVDEALARYRVQTGSLSSQRAQMFAGRVATLEKAVARKDLDELERKTAEDSLARYRNLLALAEARDALEARSPEARRRALAVALSPSFGARTRLKALASAAAPAVARRALGERDRETTGGVLLPPSA
jgi:cellulose synthase/poly-beta-1,6-N-acetylglucosamine synthase-like glycosyltransferase